MKRRHLGIALVAMVLSSVVPAFSQQVVFSTAEQIEEDFADLPCRNNERRTAVQSLFEKMGAAPETITIEKLKNVQNVVVKLEGTSSDKVIIGAHYDQTDHGCGAIDNWSGIVAMAHLYRNVRSLQPKKTVLFVAFGREEEGLIGSRAMAAAIPKEELADYCAMINIDSFGMGLPFALTSSSSPKLVKVTQEVAARVGLPLSGVIIPTADADSSSFVARKIPAVTLSGLTSDWRSVLHTSYDQVVKVNPESVRIGYRLGLALWAHIERNACDAFR
jgi:putative aminopeptidase FrvX